MRILVISNLYPPHYLGGYELGCRDVAEGLRARGHEVTVLTSTYGVAAPVDQGHVLRRLSGNFVAKPTTRLGRYWETSRRQWRNARQLARTLSDVKPELVYVFSPVGVSTSIGWLAEDQGYLVVYYVSDHWMTRTATAGWAGARQKRQGAFRSAFRRLLSRLGIAPRSSTLKARDAQFVSGFIRDEAAEAGVELESPHVVHWGVELDQLPFRAEARAARKVLFAGRIEEPKGVHTLVEAFGVAARDCSQEICLTVVGRCPSEAYRTRLQRLAEEGGVTLRVEFLAHVAREELLCVYQSHDVYVLPSEWHEPFSIGVMEAMASGLAVVATTTGGTTELCRDGENCLTYPPGDAEAAARCLTRLVIEDGLAERLRTQARREVEEGLQMSQMIDRVEGLLEASIAQHNKRSLPSS
ncbi:Glycogen synthase [Pirellulimonas nuda]|uniref:Glycogen synthase n=1 Tax=Pirellulimonas nuda TaxID=2528009 RepID=A0A518D6X3_9BACT|nr:glycosyltransferase [Pirellulimonas nuda]QDU87233.1 Glycogen synthase [Pirellulimonas nuda]